MISTLGRFQIAYLNSYQVSELIWVLFANIMRGAASVHNGLSGPN
jgi:hypothetical protein